MLSCIKFSVFIFYTLFYFIHLFPLVFKSHSCDKCLSTLNDKNPASVDVADRKFLRKLDVLNIS